MNKINHKVVLIFIYKDYILSKKHIKFIQKNIKFIQKNSIPSYQYTYDTK